MCSSNKQCEVCLAKKKVIKEAVVLDLKRRKEEMKHYARVKDMEVPRQRMAPKPNTAGLPTKSYGAKLAGLYLQDEASYVYIDKYGFDKGYSGWQGAIDYSPGAMFASSAQMANEKYVMCRALGLEKQFKQDYFFQSYYAIWQKWVKALKDAKIKNESVQLKESSWESTFKTFCNNYWDDKGEQQFVNQIKEFSDEIVKHPKTGIQYIRRVYNKNKPQLRNASTEFNQILKNLVKESKKYIIKENDNDIEEFGDAMETLENGVSLLKRFPANSLSNSIYDIIGQLEILVDKLSKEIPLNSESRLN